MEKLMMVIIMIMETINSKRIMKIEDKLYLEELIDYQ